MNDMTDSDINKNEGKNTPTDNDDDKRLDDACDFTARFYLIYLFHKSHHLNFDKKSILKHEDLLADMIKKQLLKFSQPEVDHIHNHIQYLVTLTGHHRDSYTQSPDSPRLKAKRSLNRVLYESRLREIDLRPPLLLHYRAYSIPFFTSLQLECVLKDVDVFWFDWALMKRSIDHSEYFYEFDTMADGGFKSLPTFWSLHHPLDTTIFDVLELVYMEYPYLRPIPDLDVQYLKAPRLNTINPQSTIFASPSASKSSAFINRNIITTTPTNRHPHELHIRFNPPIPSPPSSPGSPDLEFNTIEAYPMTLPPLPTTPGLIPIHSKPKHNVYQLNNDEDIFGIGIEKFVKFPAEQTDEGWMKRIVEMQSAMMMETGGLVDENEEDGTLKDDATSEMDADETGSYASFESDKTLFGNDD